MPDLILWRHGQTDHNAAGRVQGQVDIPLNDVGVAQARQTASVIAALGPSAIVSSPLQRAMQTAACLAEFTGVDVEKVAPLTERSFGAWEGLTRAEIAAGWPQQYRCWRAGEDPIGVGVETRAATAERVGQALEGLVVAGERGAQTNDAQSGPVVAVAHGAAITLGVTWLLGCDASVWSGLRGLDNCHYGVLRRGERAPGWRLVSWNCD